MSNQLGSILLYGYGMALEYAVATLRRALPAQIAITVVEDASCAGYDLFYGTVMPPVVYNFNLTAGLEEPDLILNSNTSLSYGTHYANWGSGLDWVQCFQLPLPIWSGVRFHHYLTRMGAPLEPFLPGAVAGRAGRFAHPPEDPKIALSRAEYGYLYSPDAIINLLKKATGAEGVHRIEGKISHVETSEKGIASVTLEEGQKLEADLFIDASGPSGTLISALNTHFEARYEVCHMASETPSSTGGGPLRMVEGHDFGWASSTPLRDRVLKSTICHPDNRDSALDFHGKASVKEFTLTTGRRDRAWAENCVAIGQASTIIDPLATTPFLLLMRDIERLASLIPPTTQMEVEAREYNRRYLNDCEHGELFHLAFFQTPDLPSSPFWQAVRDLGVSEKLERKITQFESRGDLVGYDLEPFNEQDWTILHFGMRRRAARHDVFIDHIDDAMIRKNLMMMGNATETLVQKMPPHGTYLNKMQNYLENNHG